MGGAKYNPVSQAGADDAIDPAIASGKQIYKKIISTGKNPIPLNLKALGAGTAAGISAESTTQNILNNARGGELSDNPYIANLERLGSRMVGGATSGAIYGKNPASAIVGAIGGAAIDAGENISGIAQAIPEALDHYKWAEAQKRKEQAETAKIVWERLQQLQKENK